MDVHLLSRSNPWRDSLNSQNRRDDTGRLGLLFKLVGKTGQEKERKKRKIRRRRRKEKKATIIPGIFFLFPFVIFNHIVPRKSVERQTWFPPPTYGVVPVSLLPAWSGPCQF
jgi:hypothetical protein